MRKTITLMLLAVFALTTNVKAQDLEGLNGTWWDCELTTNQSTWYIKKFVDGLQSIDYKQVGSGTVTFSDDCIEIKFGIILQMHFPVKRFEKITENSFCVYGGGSDGLYNYIEVVPDINDRNKYRLMIAYKEETTGEVRMHDEANNMLATKVFFCEPMKQAKNGKIVYNGLPIQAKTAKKRPQPK